MVGLVLKKKETEIQESGGHTMGTIILYTSRGGFDR